jgi:hypothetical protein
MAAVMTAIAVRPTNFCCYELSSPGNCRAQGVDIECFHSWFPVLELQTTSVDRMLSENDVCRLYAGS